MPEVAASVIVVNYQGRECLAACLDGIAALEGVAFETIVVDNASPDGSWELAQGRPGVRLVRNAENVGFGRACNQAAAVSGGRHLAFVNFDSVPEPGWLAALVATADADPALGAVQGVVLTRDGRVNTAGNRQHYLGFSWAPLEDTPPEGPPRRIACASGASVLIPRERFLEVGGFWEAFFLYCEDTDLSWRLRIAGHEIAVCPAARSVHDYAFSRNTDKFRRLERNRLMMLGANYEASTLARLAPGLLASELALLLVAARGGWLRDKLAGTADAVAATAEVRRQRRRVAALRRVGDRRLSRAFESRLGPEVGTRVADLSAPLLAAYARVMRLGVGSGVS
jgi:GT2 family glycosyltransferase